MLWLLHVELSSYQCVANVLLFISKSPMRPFFVQFACLSLCSRVFTDTLQQLVKCETECYVSNAMYYSCDGLTTGVDRYTPLKLC